MRIANHTYSGLPTLGVRLAVDRNPAHERRRPFVHILLGAAALCCVGLFSIIGGIVSTDNEIRRYFEMPAYIGAVPENIQVAIWQDLPIGSSRSDVEHFLARSRNREGPRQFLFTKSHWAQHYLPARDRSSRLGTHTRNFQPLVHVRFGQETSQT